MTPEPALAARNVVARRTLSGERDKQDQYPDGDHKDHKEQPAGNALMVLPMVVRPHAPIVMRVAAIAAACASELTPE